ncbi:MAG TPA: dienelactone hydrolase family protein [Pyrinomonadaceae bacterium]|nr:dienelactone hydrolase family protein [Pyrinomonadaceae bacterium]
MCVECDDEKRLSRRAFVKGATIAVAGAAFGLDTVAQQNVDRVLNDPNITSGDVEFKSGSATIKGFLARPKKSGRHRMVLIAHGNAGVPPDIKFTAAELAKAGYVSLVYDWASRDPLPADLQDRDKWVARITSYTFIKLQMQDLDAAISYLRQQPFTKRERVGMVGFCGGGRLGYLFSTRSRDVKAMVSLYGPVVYHVNNPKADPVPDVLNLAGQIKVPVQGHYGLLDQVAKPDDAKLLEKEMRRRLKKPVEMYYYEGAGHSFCNFTRPQGSDPGYDHNPEAAALAHQRMIKFLRQHLA